MRIGLISDTHMPERWKTLPSQIFDLWTGEGRVDLILHAGDVGKLWVLDQLSAIAPVVAVHGNDETSEATAALPYLQTLMLAGHRLVLTHAHYPDRQEELASRVNAWQPHFARRANFAKQHGADIVVFGHTHIPMCLEHDGIWLINSGAIASGNAWSQQILPSVATLELHPNQPPQVTHHRLPGGDIFNPTFDPRGFMETAQHYERGIVDKIIYQQREWLWWTLRPLAPEAVTKAILGLAFECWEGQRASFSAQDLAQRLHVIPHENVQALLRTNPAFALET